MAAWTLSRSQTGRCLPVRAHSVERRYGSGSHRLARSRFRDAAGKGPPQHAAGYRDFRKFTAGIFRASRYLATVRRATTNPCSASNSAMRLSERGDFESSAPISCLMSARIAVDDAVRGIPERHGVEEGFGIRGGELKRPVLACVGGVIDARLVACSGGHEEGVLGGKCDDAAKVERIGAGDGVFDAMQ